MNPPQNSYVLASGSSLSQNVLLSTAIKQPEGRAVYFSLLGGQGQGQGLLYIRDAVNICSLKCSACATAHGFPLSR